MIVETPGTDDVVIYSEWMKQSKGFENHCLLRGWHTNATHPPPPPKKNVQVIIYQGDGVKKTLNNVTPIPRETDRFMFQLNEQTKLFFQLQGSFPLLFLYV